ncbi:protein kinase domain-containing protein [Nonomuraea longispora]|uniref:protein kinase domain-containing protein n=1 Tax=Nonomuraea longispora TaxID=1848320 RepID=UPI003CCC5930
MRRRTTHHVGRRQGHTAFMSPEQVEGRQTSPASDIFSWGSTMYFAATGRPAFDGPSVWAVENQIINSHPDLRMVPPPLRELVQQAMLKPSHERPTASQLFLLLSR